MSTVLDRVLLSPHGLRLVRRFKEHPRDLWEHHEAHQTISSSSQRIAIFLSGKLATMKMSESESKTAFLEDFDMTIEKFDKVSADKMPALQKISLLKQVVHADKQLLQAWTAVESIVAHGSTPGTAITYEKSMEYLISHSEALEASTVDNTKRRVNVADFMDSYNQEDSYYNEATHLAVYMGERGDVDEFQMVLECNQALCDGKSCPRQKLRREQRPSRPELQIKGPV